MSAAREAVLGTIRKALSKRKTGAAQVATRVAVHGRNLVPERGRVSGRAAVDDFQRMATDAAASVVRVASWKDLPGAVQDILRRDNCAARLVMAPDTRLRALPWRERMLEVREGRAEPDDAVSVGRALAAVAETGTLMLASGPDSPTTLGFLPELHIVAVDAADVVGAYEDGWDRVRAKGAMPRTVNFITGPSRSADIEQTLQMGAHGPRKLAIVIVDEEAG
jgi:L-lactate dehydrogenase complex protein LldG